MIVQVIRLITKSYQKLPQIDLRLHRGSDLTTIPTAGILMQFAERDVILIAGRTPWELRCDV
jgi:hypothetical protein